MEDLITKKKQILSVKELPTLPEVLNEVTKMIEEDRFSQEEIAKVISKDQSLTAKILKMVNSPIYGFPRRISTVQHALVLLGLNVVKGLIISTTVFDMMTKAMKGMWEHSVGCATICSLIAKEVGFENPEEFSIAGLLHDIGKVIVAVQLPDSYEKINQLVKEKDISYREAEEEVLGFSHSRINLWISDYWNLPLNLKEGLTYHHKPVLAKHYPEFAHVVHIGDFLTKLFGIGFGGDDQVPKLYIESLKFLKISLKKLEKILDFLSDNIEEIKGISL